MLAGYNKTGRQLECSIVGREEGKEEGSERKGRRLRKYQKLIGGNMGRGRRPHFDLWEGL